MYVPASVEVKMRTKKISPEKLDEILNQIALFSIDLVEDPTLPEYGARYITKVSALCRNYQNRVQTYMQEVKRAEISLKKEIKVLEADVDMKTAELLAKDDVVKRQSSIEDRKALAYSILSNEHKSLTDARIELQDVEESYKILKMRYDQLKLTSNDIKAQRLAVKDEIELTRDGGGGSSKAARSGGVIERGIPPIVRTHDNPSIFEDTIQNVSPVLPVPVRDFSEAQKDIEEFLKSGESSFSDSDSSISDVKSNMGINPAVDLDGVPGVIDLDSL